MSAVNLGCIWKKNTLGRTGPFKFPLKFDAGANQTVKTGEILDTSGSFVAPLASDKSMTSIIAVADIEIRSGDLAGYRLAIIPQPGDLFELDLSAAAAPAVAAALYYNTSQKLATSGSNIIGYVQDESMIPLQGSQSVNPSYDAGTTLRTVSRVLFCFKQSVSYWNGLSP
jgi:hypothetical protein